MRFLFFLISESWFKLKECIRCIDQFYSHAPFRQSKLTRVLRDCFIGSGRTVLIATVSPTDDCVPCSLNTLQYANRVRQMTLRNRKRNDDKVTTTTTTTNSRSAVISRRLAGHNENFPTKSLHGLNEPIRKLTEPTTTQALSSVAVAKSKSAVNSKPPNYNIYVDDCDKPKARATTFSSLTNQVLIRQSKI